VARRIKKCVDAGRRRKGEIAVLYRSNSLARALETELRAQGIAYRVVGGQAFYERREVKDLIAYLRLCLNPTDELSLRRVINSPPRGIGPRTVAKLSRWAEERDGTLYRALQQVDAVLGPGDRAGTAVKGFVGLLQRTRSRLRRGQLAAGVRQLVVDLDLESEVRRGSSAAATADRRWRNVTAFVESVARFERERPGATLRDLLAKVALNNAEDDYQQEHAGDMVTLSTLHGAKGLEFSLVFLVGVEEGFLPHDRTVNPQANDCVSGDVAEERRLLYVGITRARDELVLTRAAQRQIRGRPQPRSPSRFIAELEPRLELEDLTAEPPPEQVKAMMADLRALLGGS